MKKNCCFAVLIAFVMVISSCVPETKIRDIKGDCVGIVFTQPHSKDTKFLSYDETGSLIGEKSYRMEMVGRFGFGVPQSRNGVMYEIANGDDFKKDAGIVVGYDLINDDIEEISFGRSNLVDLWVTGEYIVVLSNKNHKTYFDWYSFDTHEIDTYVLDNEMLADFTVSNDNNIFFFTSQKDLLMISIKEKTVKKISSQAPSEAAYMFESDGNVYISKAYETDEMQVIEPDGKSHFIELGVVPVGQPYYYDGYLYVSNEDPVIPGMKGNITKIRLSDEKIVSSWSFDHNISQFCVSGDAIYTLDWRGNKLRYYSNPEDDSLKPVLKKEIDISQEDDDYRLSAMAVVNVPY